MQGEIDLKRFKKIKRISNGGFGLVYQVQEKETGQLYAAKIIDCEDDLEICNGIFSREVNILMYTKHPTIIKFVGFSKLDFNDENNITIIMELAKNGSLREVLKQIHQNDGPSNYTNTTRQIILVGVARGMKYLHNRNIIHRDIKPENILLDENFQPHITDFGLSKFYENGHSHSQTKFGGTLEYEAPEILNNKKYDVKVDVYSFSILMFEVLTDSVPYPELTKHIISALDFMYKVAKESYRPKFNVPVKDSLRKLTEKCWSENPDDRPTFDEIFDKLANKTLSEEGENFLLDDVDIDELNLYVGDITEITDSTEKLLSKISVLEEENRQLKNENEELKSENKKQMDKNKKLEENIIKLKNEIKRLKLENKKQIDTNKSIKEKGHEKSKDESEKIELKSNHTKAIVGGYDKYNLLGEKPNRKSAYGYHSIISPPLLNSSINFSSLLSYSVYSGHSVLVMRNGSLFGIGYNKDGRISNSLTKTKISNFTKFSIKDSSGRQLIPISAICSQYRTLYMFSNISGSGNQLIYCDCKILNGKPVFLDIGKEKPMSLFGGCDHLAAISDERKVIFISRDEVINSSYSKIESVSLPNEEKASCIACLCNLIVVLSSNGRVFSSSIESGTKVIDEFSQVSELDGYEIVWLSGVNEHCLAVSKEGRVFGIGSNYNGQLGLGEEIYSVSSFTEISSLKRYRIRAAYAGHLHSLFETSDGKILACGSNKYGELLLQSGICDEKIYSPRETVVTGGASFCIAGYDLSVVFVGGNPPPNTPNLPIKYH